MKKLAINSVTKSVIKKLISKGRGLKSFVFKIDFEGLYNDSRMEIIWYLNFLDTEGFISVEKIKLHHSTYAEDVFFAKYLSLLRREMIGEARHLAEVTGIPHLNKCLTSECTLKDLMIIYHNPAFVDGASFSIDFMESLIFDIRIKDKLLEYVALNVDDFAEKEEEENITIKPVVAYDTVSFDADRAILIFKGNEIKFSGSKNCDVLRTLFSDINKVWGLDELQLDSDGSEVFKWRTMWNRCYAINTTIAKQCRVRDFVKFDSESAQINPTYLKKQESPFGDF